MRRKEKGRYDETKMWPAGCRSFYVSLNPGHEGEAPDLTEAEAKELAWVLEFQNSVTKQKGEYWISVYDGECLGQDYTA